MGVHWGRKLARWLLRRRRRNLWMIVILTISITLLYRGWRVMTILGPGARLVLQQHVRQVPANNASNQPVSGPLPVSLPVLPAASASNNNHYHHHPATLTQTEAGGHNSGLEGQNASHEDGGFNFTEWARVQDERARRLRDGCAGHSSLASSAFTTRSIVDLNHRYLYCPVEKSASTFFRRFMYSLQHSAGSRQIVSPFDVPIDTALKHRFVDLRSTFRRDKDPLMMNGTRFVVVREPFSRIYSAYVDKVLVPNSYYWKVWSLNIVSRFRKSPSERARRCGHDVTFPEFVKYVISTLYNINEHVKPVDRQCAPCSLKFSVIGHMETLKWDFQYLLKVLNVHIVNFSADALMADVVSDAISDSTYSVFFFYSELKDCVSLYETYQKLWLKMQLRGIISEDIPLPLSAEQAEKVNATQMVHILHEAHQNSQDAEKLHQQKANALKNAYASVSSEDLKTLVKIYELDFDLFGYDKHPSFGG